jgi:multisubunit Na+/H+ antiporter MnhC subunit
MNVTTKPQPAQIKLRTWLLVAVACVTIFGIFHHVDHVVRGNHSGWPFEEAVTPFTFSLLIYALLLPGLYLTTKGRLMAGYWLFTAVVGLALVVWVHFVPTGDYEAPIEDIYAVYGSPLAGLLALVVLTGLVSSLATLAIAAIQALRSTKRS